MAHRPDSKPEAGISRENLGPFFRCKACGEPPQSCNCLDMAGSQSKPKPTFEQVRDSIPQEDRGL